MKRTVPELAERITEATGLTESSVRTISRRLREAGHLSQTSQGGIVAAATARDAALILLVAAAEMPPLHAVAMGEALLACDIRVSDYSTDPADYSPDGKLDPDWRKPDWPDELPLAESAIDQVALLIGGGEVGHVMLGIGSSVGVSINVDEETDRYVAFGPERDHPAIAKLASLLGKYRTIKRRHEIAGQTLRDIGDWLNEAEAEAEDSAA